MPPAANEHSERTLPPLVLTGERVGGAYLVVVHERAVWLTGAPFEALLNMLWRLADTFTGYAAVSRGDAFKVRKGLCRLIVVEGGDKKQEEYRLGLDHAEVGIDPSADELPENVLPRDRLKQMKDKFTVLAESVLPRFRQSRTRTKERQRRDGEGVRPEARGGSRGLPSRN